MPDKKNKPQKERYNFSARESYWQKFWEREKVYEFNPSSESPLYTIDTPPPTISGSLHLGHIYSYTQAEVIGRYKRMAGFNVRYPFGYDDNGLPTERLVEKELGIKAQDQSLEDFRKKCIKVIRGYVDEFRNLWRSVGLSVDWRLEYSTISDEVQKMSQATFIQLYEKGAIYRQEAPALYCHECRTSIAQAEVEDKEIPSVFYDLAFSTNEEKLTISTTRPELLPACVTVFVHPSDKRYQHFIGKEVTTPLGDRVKVMTDELVSMEKGSGVVMCCTFGDETDLGWVRKYKLPHKVIIDETGHIGEIENASFLKGLTIVEAREEIVRRLREQGYITGERQIDHSVGVHERCATPVEIIPRTQWFVRILDKKDELLKAGERINWYPAHMKKRYMNWVTNLKWDWCVSRERFFGIPVPAYICGDCDEVILPKENDLPLDPKGKKVVQICSHCGSHSIQPESMVLDTWFTSALTPDINNQHQLNERFQGKMLPMSMRPQAHDIIRTWAVYSILMSLYGHEDIPWHDLMISGHVLVKKGEKISKKTGGGKYIPQELISQHSADVVRYAMCQAGLGKDSYYDDGQVENGKKLVTKLYNSGKFTLANLNDFDPSTEIKGQLIVTDQWILQRMRDTARSMAREFERYEYAKALGEFERFFWSDFTDNYLELIKGRLYSREKNSTERISAQHALYHVYGGILKMIAPFLPHITEEMYHAEFIQTGDTVMQGRLASGSDRGYFYRQNRTKSIHGTQWGNIVGEKGDEKLMKGAALMLEVIANVRKFKSERKMKLGSPLQRIVIECSDQDKINLLEGFIGDVISISRSEEVFLTLAGDKKDYQADLVLRL